MAVNSSRVIKGDRVAMRWADRSSQSSHLHMYVYMDGKAPNTRAFLHSSPPCGGSLSWHMMEEQTKKNHFPLEDWTCQPPPVAVAVVALPEWQGAPSSPAGEEVKREDKKTGWI